MALGASTDSVLRIVLARGLRLMWGGLVVGTALTFALGHLLNGSLYGVNVWNPIIASIAALLLVLAGSIACYIPAHRATKIDPMSALRYE